MSVTQPPKPSRRPRRGALLALGCAGFLAACSGGSEKLGSESVELVRGTLRARLTGGETAAKRVSPAQIAQARAQARQPLVLIDFPRIGSNALIAKIGENGPVDTYATAARQTVSLENGWPAPAAASAAT